MPLCPQITITPITVTTSGMTTTSVIAANAPATTEQLSTTNASAAAAQAAAAAAQAEAATALAAANTAYTTAINSLQPSAYAIQNPTTKQLTAIDATGLTVYSGASSTSGARVVLNSTGLAGFNSGGTATFSVSASTGAAIFSGSVTGATITGGTLNIGGNAIINSSGFLTATGATITGTITATSGTFTGTVNATSGYIGSPTNGWQFRSDGTLSNNGNSTILYPSSATNIYALITDRAIAPTGVQSGGDIYTTGSAIINANGSNFNRNYFSYYNTISLQSITGGYGIDSDWAPNSDNTYNLGQATSAGYGANRRWQRLYSNNTTISTSDVRLKTDVSDSPLGLDFINALRPVNYKWIVGRQEVAVDSEGKAIIIGETAEGKPIFQMEEIPGSRLHYGFIAQEVKQVLDSTDAPDFAGWVQDDLSDPDSTQSLSYEQFIAPLTKAVQELTARVIALETK
jgi:hypothetical protein